MKPYADSNFFTRVYLDLEAGTAEAAALLKLLVPPLNSFLPVTRLHRLEVLNAFEMMAYHSAKQGQHHITREAAAIAQATFRDDCREQSFLRLCIPVETAVDRQYEELVLRHTPPVASAPTTCSTSLRPSSSAAIPFGASMNRFDHLLHSKCVPTNEQSRTKS